MLKNELQPLVSVLLCTHNDGDYLHGCISSILSQSYQSFELIILDDASNDETANIVSSFSDARIQYFYSATFSNGNIAKVRNQIIPKASGDYIFFMDGDCHAKENWLEQAMNYFLCHNCQLLEGKVVYHQDGYIPSLSDRTIENLSGGRYLTGNMGYRRSIFEYNQFNTSYPRGEDRELGLRLRKKYPIPFVDSCVVYHYRKTRNLRSFFQSGALPKLRMIKELNDDIGPFHILQPELLAVLLFPPLLLGLFFYGRKRIRTYQDLCLLPFVWIKAVYIRYLIWKTAWREKIWVF